MTKFLLFLILSLPLWGQTPSSITPPGTTSTVPQVVVQQQAAPTLNGILAAVTKMDNLTPAMFILSSVANSSTDYKFVGPITGRQYNISAMKATGITGAVIGVALAVRYLWPKSAKFVDAGLVVGAGALAGSAYAHTLNHGTATTTSTTTAGVTK